MVQRCIYNKMILYSKAGTMRASSLPQYIKEASQSLPTGVGK